MNSDNAQEAYELFHNRITQFYERHFPYRKIKLKKYIKDVSHGSPKHSKQQLKRKNGLCIKQLKSDNVIIKKQYLEYKNKLQKILRSAERKYYHQLIEEHKSNLTSSWRILKMVINRNKVKKNVISFKDNNSVIDDPTAVASRFNNFFTNIGPTLAKAIPKSNSSPVEYLNDKVKESILFSPVLENEVNMILNNLKNSAAEWDGFEPKIVKGIKNSILTPLVHICNLSITTGIVPNHMKIANVVPIFKSGDDALFTNYRPVSVLPIFSKVLERLVYNRLIAFLDKYKVIYEYQFGFRKKYSTHLALISLIDKLSSAMDQGDKVIGIFLDFSKAFDTVDHNILLLKLEHYGIRGTALDWFRDYMSGRKQFVTYNGVKSSRFNVSCGVPQGSILGPLLFLSYVNDIQNVTHHSFPLLFADDSNLFVTVKDLEIVENKANEDLCNIIDWLYANKLSLNIKKTHYIVFTSGNVNIMDLNIKIKNCDIFRVYSTKFLGVHIDSKLKWKQHINYRDAKLSKCIGILIKARMYLPKSSLLTLYYTFAYPYFLYCIHVWGKTYQSYLKILRSYTEETNPIDNLF